MRPAIGVIGAGKLGTTIARAATDAGFEVSIAGSGPPSAIALTVEVLAPGAQPKSLLDVANGAELIVLAIPLHRVRELSAAKFAGRVVVDATNYWQPADGDDPELAEPGTSLFVQRHLASALIVKGLNQLGYHEFAGAGRAAGADDRVALGVAGDDRDAVTVVMEFVGALGFDAVDGGGLHRGWLLEPDGSPYAPTRTAGELRELLAVSDEKSG